LRKVYLQTRISNIRKAHIKMTRGSWSTNSTRIILSMIRSSSLKITNFKRMSSSTLRKVKASIRILWKWPKKQWWARLMRLIRKSSKS
jgi:hypothetical protein